MGRLMTTSSSCASRGSNICFTMRPPQRRNLLKLQWQFALCKKFQLSTELIASCSGGDISKREVQLKKEAQLGKVQLKRRSTKPKTTPASTTRTTPTKMFGPMKRSPKRTLQKKTRKKKTTTRKRKTKRKNPKTRKKPTKRKNPRRRKKRNLPAGNDGAKHDRKGGRTTKHH